MTRSGFTLVELLVVITIIVVLLSLLAPAMDKAVYQAELTACAARLKAHGSAATIYAMDHKRHYLYRLAVRNGTAWRPDYLAFTSQNAGHDDRPMLRPYMPINKLMACPFVKEVEFDRAAQAGNLVQDVLLYTSYAYWYGFRYIGRKGMFKLGDRLEWKEGATGPTSYFNVLVTDTDIEDFGGPWTNSAHPDKDSFLALTTVRNVLGQTQRAYVYYSYWGRWSTLPARGPMERNFAFDDNSVQMWENLEIDDDRVVAVGGHTNLAASGVGGDTGYRTWLPAH